MALFPNSVPKSSPGFMDLVSYPRLLPRLAGRQCPYEYPLDLPCGNSVSKLNPVYTGVSFLSSILVIPKLSKRQHPNLSLIYTLHHMRVVSASIAPNILQKVQTLHAAQHLHNLYHVFFAIASAQYPSAHRIVVVNRPPIPQIVSRTTRTRIQPMTR